MNDGCSVRSAGMSGRPTNRLIWPGRSGRPTTADPGLACQSAAAGGAAACRARHPRRRPWQGTRLLDKTVPSATAACHDTHMSVHQRTSLVVRPRSWPGRRSSRCSRPAWRAASPSSPRPPAPARRSCSGRGSRPPACASGRRSCRSSATSTTRSASGSRSSRRCGAPPACRGPIEELEPDARFDGEVVARTTYLGAALARRARRARDRRSAPAARPECAGAARAVARPPAAAAPRDPGDPPRSAASDCIATASPAS